MGKNKENGWICSYCKLNFKTRRKLYDHKNKEHKNESLKKLYECEFCGLKKVTLQNGMSFHEKYCKKNPQSIKWNARSIPQEERKKISESMKKAHSENRAWNIGQSRWNNKPSYPEQFFMEVIENEFVDKIYIREYSFYKFSLDFVWLHKKCCIEIDGIQHERFKEQIRRDKEKDVLLEQEGWKLLRIKWKDIFYDSKKWIKISKNFIDDCL